MIANRVCNISLSTLKSEPYLLTKGDSIYAKIISTNVYGDSVVYSNTGNGAVIQLTPDAPISLANDPTTTSDTVIRITWTEGLSDGGTKVIDYSVYIQQGTEDFILIASAIVSNSYTTTMILIPGVTY